MNNQHWYDVNELTDYPIDDAASAEADDGARLPTRLVADLNLRYPAAYGDFPYLGAVTVSRGLVSVVVEVAASMDAPYGARAVAVLSLPRAGLAVGRNYALTPQADGVGGWVVFGSGATEFGDDGVPAVSYRFGTPGQSLLTARAARKYRPLPVSGLRSYTGTGALTGVVDLVADAPLEILRASRLVGGVERDVALVRLADAESVSGFETSQQEQALQPLTRSPNVFQQFAGRCGGRPESQTCGDPQPVEFVNSVAPDCDGVLTLDFRGCASAVHLADPCTILLRCNFALDQVCQPPFIPDAEGRLPNEYDPADIGTSTTTEGPTAEPPDETQTDSGELPFVECFDDEPFYDFVVREGTWDAAIDDSPGEGDYCPYSYTHDGDSINVSETEGSYESRSYSVKNLVTWNGFDALNIDRVTTTDLKLMPPAPGGKRNGGLVLNYKPHDTVAGRFVYFAAELDYDTQQLRLRRFNGLQYSPVVELNVPGVMLERWYRLTVTAVEGPLPGQTTLTVRLIDLEGSLDVTLGPVNVSSYVPSSGYNGLLADRARTRFAFFSYAEA